jgi:hypothetical protein
VKQFGIIAILVSFSLVQGCSSSSRDSAGRTAEVTNPPAATELAVSSNVPAPLPRLDPAANGGSDLPASAPYRQANGQPVQQNINAAPFMVAAGGQGGGSSSGAALLTSGGFANRADGTMSGPNDQPAASTGWGTPGPQAIPAATSSKPATQSRKNPK